MRRGRLFGLMAVVALLAASLTALPPARAQGPGLTATIPVTLTNGGATATGPFEAMVVFPSNQYAAYIASNWSNVEFFYANGTTVPSWVEANASSASATTVVWLNLVSINPGGSLTVYAETFSSFVLSASGPSGVGPKLMSPYAAWDDGAQVFPYYQDWKGTTAPGGWTWNSATGTLTVNNGATAFAGTSSGSNYAWTGGTGIVGDSYRASFLYAGITAGSGFDMFYVNNGWSCFVGDANAGLLTSRIYGSDMATAIALTNGVAYVGAVSSTATHEWVTWGQTPLRTGSGTTTSGTVQYYVDQSLSDTTNWFFEYVTPPSNTMPSDTFGAAVLPPIPYAFPLLTVNPVESEWAFGGFFILLLVGLVAYGIYEVRRHGHDVFIWQEGP